MGREDEARRLADVPVWAFHGGRDLLVPARASKRMVEWHQDAGGEAQLTVFEGAGHEIWDLVFTDSALYDWLVSKRRETAAGR